MNKGIRALTQKCIYRKLIFSCALVCCTFFCRVWAQDNTNDKMKDSCLQVYLPREVTISENILKLGKIGIVRGPENLVSKAGEIKLGRLSVPGQEIVVERHVVLSRLASCGIPASQVTFQGAENVTVRQRHDIISSEQFVELAGSCLKQNLTDDSVADWSLVRKPKDLVIPNPGNNIKFSSELIKDSAKNQAKINIKVFSDDKQIGVRDVTFSLKYNNHTAVALVDIPAGTIINSDNIKIEKTESNYPEPAGWKPPYGFVAKRMIPAETAIEPHMFDAAQSPVVIKRNQNVVIRIEKPGFLITAVGKAMQDGKVGEYIKIRNIDSQRILVAKVNSDRTVEPVF